MIIEFQLDPQPFLVAFRNQMKGAAVCLTDSVPIAEGSCSGPCLLDHIKVWDGTSLTRDASGNVMILQPVDLYFVSVADLEVNGTLPSTACWMPTILLGFSLTVAVEQNTPQLTLTYLAVQPESTVPPLVANFIDSVLTPLLPPQSTPLDLSSLEDALQGSVTVLMAGLGGDVNFNRVAIRLEIQSASPNSAANWTQFFAGQILPLSQSTDWTLFVDKDVLVGTITDQFNASFDDQAADNKFALDTGPDVLYLPGGAPQFMVTFDGEAINACVCLWGEIDLDVSLTANITLSVPETNVLQMEMQIFWNLGDAEVVCCAFSSMLFWPLIGTNLLQQGTINWGEFLAGVAFLPLVFTSGLINAHDTAGEKFTAPPGWKEVPTPDEDSKTFLQSSTLNFSDLGLGQMSLDSVIALPNGPLLRGTFVAPAELADPELVVDFQFAPFEWGFTDRCAEDPILTASSSVTLKNAAAPSGQPQVPLHICDVHVVPGTDPANQFGPYLTWNDNSIAFEIADKQIKPDYSGSAFPAGNYPCQLQVISNGGCRILSIPPIPILTNEEIQKKYQERSLWAIFGCRDDLAAGYDFWKGSKYNPKWGPNPPPGVVVMHLWQLVVSGLKSGEVVNLHHTDGALIGSAHASVHGAAQLTALVSPTSIGDISLTRVRGEEQSAFTERAVAAGTVRRGAGQQLLMKQLLLVEQAQLMPGGTVLTVEAGRFGASQVLAAVTARGLKLYDVTLLSMPRLVFHQRVTGLRGVMPWQDGFLAWGDDGLHLAGKPTAAEASAAFGPRSVLRAARRGRHLYLLTREGVLVYDRGLRQVGRLDVEGLEQLAISGSILAVASKREVRFLDLTSPVPVALPGRYQLEDDLVALWPARIAGVRSAFFAEAASGGGPILSLAGVSEVNKAEESIRFLENPWFVGAATAGKTFVRLGTDRETISIYSVNSTATLLR